MAGVPESLTAQNQPRPWIAVAPIFGYVDRHDVFAHQVEMSDGIGIGPIPQWCQGTKVTDQVSKVTAHNLREASIAFICNYESSHLGELQPNAKGRGPRSWQDYADSMIRYANTSLWISKPSTIGFQLIIHADIEDGQSNSAMSIESWSSALCQTLDERNSITTEDVDTARKIHSAFVSMQEAQGAPIILLGAVHYLWKALIEYAWESRFVFLWIVVEALFGPDDGREITYRLSNRVAHFLGNSQAERRRIFDKTKSAYIWRSKIVHGV